MLLQSFGSKCYILKEERNGKVDVKGDEGIFLGYSNRSKAYKCLNLSTYKIIESAHVRIDEFAEKNEEESNKEPEDYKRFIYYETDTFPNLIGSQETSPAKSRNLQKHPSCIYCNPSQNLKDLSLS